MNLNDFSLYAFLTQIVLDIWVPVRFVWAGAKLSWARFRGFRTLATPEEQSERLNVCENCEHMTVFRQCDICKCFLNEKTLLTTEKCPLRKWLPIREHNHTVI